MKRFAIFAVMALVALSLNLMTADSVSARPEYKSKLEELTKDMKGADAIKEAKCNTCHYGKSKKNRNDFGAAINKSIDEATYKELKSDKEKLTKKVEEAIKAAFKAKSPDGKTFGDLIEAGELPAKNPEE